MIVKRERYGIFPKNAVLQKKRIWPDQRIPYVLSRHYNKKARSLIARAFEIYHKRTCLKFEPKTEKEENFIYIFPGPACYSRVGKVGGMQELSLGTGCVHLGVIIHELMHAIGFWHEHSRDDRDSYVKIHWNNIMKGKFINQWK